MVSPHRAKRPWQGQIETVSEGVEAAYDEQCFLCPGNKRVNGEVNQVYETTYVFNNDFAALKPDTPAASSNDPLFTMSTELGESRVICF